MTRAKTLLTSKESIAEYANICVNSIKANINMAKVARECADKHSFDFWIKESEKEIAELIEFMK